MSLRTEVGLALLLGGAVTVAIVVGRSSTTPAAEFEPASTFRAGPAGSRGVYDVLVRLGLPVARRRTSLFALATDRATRPALLVVNDPPEGLEEGELRQVTRYLEDSGEVLAVGEAGGIARCVGWAVRPLFVGIRPESVSVAPSGGVNLPNVTAYLRPVGGAEPVQRGLPVAPPTIREMQDTRCGSLVAKVADTLVRTRSGRPVVLRLTFPSGGRLTLAADDDWFRNRAWRTTNLPVVLLPIFSPADRRIRCDEYHHGYAGGAPYSGASGWMVTTPGGRATLQLTLVVLIGFGVAALRFGPARPVIERRRRSPLEHVDALAAGLESAGGSETALMLVVAGLRRRLSRTGRAPRGDARQWLATLALAMNTPRGRQAATQLSRLLTQPGGGERVLAAANSVEDVWEELRPRTTHDAS